MLKSIYFADTMKLEFLSDGYSKLDKRLICGERRFPFTRLYYIYRGSRCGGDIVGDPFKDTPVPPSTSSSSC